MKLKFKNADVTISDDSPEAIKILQGFDYSFENGKLSIGTEKKHYDILDFESKVEKDKHTKLDIDNFLKELVKIYKKIKYNME